MDMDLLVTFWLIPNPPCRFDSRKQIFVTVVLYFTNCRTTKFYSVVEVNIENLEFSGRG